MRRFLFLTVFMGLTASVIASGTCGIDKPGFYRLTIQGEISNVAVASHDVLIQDNEGRQSAMDAAMIDAKAVLAARTKSSSLIGAKELYRCTVGEKAYAAVYSNAKTRKAAEQLRLRLNESFKRVP